MKTIDKLFSLINIPDDGQFTSKNNKYFVFSKNDEGLRGKNSAIMLVLITVAFLLGFFFQNKSQMIQYTFWAISFVLSAIYMYNYRFVLYRNNARYQSGFSRYKQMMKYINLIVESKRIYDYDMPLAYYILKCKELINDENYISAEHLSGCARKEYGPLLPIVLLQIVSMYKQQKYDTAVPLLEKIAENEHVDTQICCLCRQLADEITL